MRKLIPGDFSLPLRAKRIELSIMQQVVHTFTADAGGDRQGKIVFVLAYGKEGKSHAVLYDRTDVGIARYGKTDADLAKI